MTDTSDPRSSYGDVSKAARLCRKLKYAAISAGQLQKILKENIAEIPPFMPLIPAEETAIKALREILLHKKTAGADVDWMVNQVVFHLFYSSRPPHALAKLIGEAI